MTAHIALLFADSSWSAVLLSSRSLGIALWVGLAVLSLALLILMRTHWGQAQPLSKCIVLSVFAHMLLFMYAYGTRLFVDRPPGPRDEPIQLAFLQPGERSEEVERQVKPQPWDELTADRPPDPEVTGPDRTAVATPEIPRTSAADEWSAASAAMPSDQLPDTEPDRATETAVAPTPLRPERSPVAAAVIDSTPRKRAVDRAPVMPEEMVPDRMQTAPPATRRTVEQGEHDRLPSQLVDIGSRMQQLADVEPRSETADSLPGRQDQLSQSENRGDSAVESTGILAERSAREADDFEPLVAIPAGPALAHRSPDRLRTEPPKTVEQIASSIPRRLGDGQPLPGPYRLRSAAARDAIAASLGGGTRSAAAVESALAWLAAQQEKDGRWDPDRWGAGIETRVAGEDRGGAGISADTGITALAILAFLANGESHLEGIYRKNVQHGLEYLLRSQTADGNLAGDARFCAQMYCHGMASLALSEALALTGDVRIQPYVQRAVDYTVNAQHPTSGGWRYQPGDKGDMSQFGWQVMALKSAELAGITIPRRTREGMLHFLGLCQKGTHGGLAGYRPGMPPTPPMTAEALVCRYFIQVSPDPAQVAEASDFLLGELPDAGVANYYYWYYGTLAMFQTQGEAWQQWNDAMQRELTRRQRTDGHLAGSWDPDSVWGNHGGRVYSTAMATLCLEVYYRYLPLTAVAENSQ